MENMFPSKETSADPLPVEDKTFSKEELQNYLMPIWNSLDEMNEASPFRGSVKPKLLNKKEDNFFTFIKKPMKLIRKNLKKGMYTNPREFCDDIWLMFNNASLNNQKNSKVYKSCSKLAECFANAINPVMCNMGYCCGQKCTFTPLPLFCYSQRKCVIKRDQEYYLYESGSTQSGVTVSDKYIYCLKCFNKLQEEGKNENLNETPNMTKKFIKMKNTQIEPFESCKDCKRKWHRICASFNKKVFPEGFICDTCRKEKRIPKPENKFTAKKLPHCQLSRHIEDRVNQYMIKEGGLSAGQYEVVIRVLCAVDKEVEVKPMMKQKYAGFPDRFPYRSKAIFAYEVVDGTEICFFGLYVQEYGNNCPSPNRGRVYIAYLDSVHFFQPKHLRTNVYHEILLGYLEYVKKLGYTMAHIWASPPSEGDDYIFHCHPPEQKIPTIKLLQDWYEKMLKKGIKEKIVVEYKDTLPSKAVQRQSKYDAVQTPPSLPYFEGNFLPNIIEGCIRDVEKEENERRKQKAAQTKDGDEEIYQVDDESRAKKSNKSSNNKKKNNLKKPSKKKSGGGAGDKVMNKLYTFLKNHNEVFFTVHLVSHQEPAMNKPIQDPDPPVSSELMDSRDTFLNKARDEHWEFSSLRRARYSSLCFCHALHTQEDKNMAYTCDNCNNTNACWHCTTCDDFDLCASCYNTVTHEHKFEKISTIIGVSDSKNAESANTRNKSVKRCNQYLIHACQCIDANCCRKTCHKMKKVVSHTKQCKKRQQTKCPVCKQLITLCYYHAKHCNQQSCPVLFCSKIRQKLQAQKRSRNRRDDKLMRRKMEMPNAGASNGGGSVYASTSSVSAIPPSNHPHIPPTMQANAMHFGTNGMSNQDPVMGMNLAGTRPMNDMADMNSPPGYSSQDDFRDDLIEKFGSSLNIHTGYDRPSDHVQPQPCPQQRYAPPPYCNPPKGYQAPQPHWPIGASGQQGAQVPQRYPHRGYQAPQLHWPIGAPGQPGAPAPQNCPTHGYQAPHPHCPTSASRQPTAPPPPPRYAPPLVQNPQTQPLHQLPYQPPPQSYYPVHSTNPQRLNYCLPPSHQTVYYQGNPPHQGYYPQEQHVQIYSQLALAKSLASPSMASEPASTKINQLNNKRKHTIKESSKHLSNNNHSELEKDFLKNVKLLKSTFHINKFNKKWYLEDYKEKIHTNLTNCDEDAFMVEILGNKWNNGLAIMKRSCLQFYLTKMLPILIDEYAKMEENEKNILYELIWLDYFSVFKDKDLIPLKERAQIWWNNTFLDLFPKSIKSSIEPGKLKKTLKKLFDFKTPDLNEQFIEWHKHIGLPHGGFTAINRYDKTHQSIIIRPLPPDTYTINPPPAKRQKLSKLDEYPKNPKSRVLLLTIDTRGILTAIIELKGIRWDKLVPIARNYYEENDNPPVFATFYNTERSPSGLIFMIPAYSKEEEKHVICSNIWTTNHDNDLWKRKNSPETNLENLETQVKCHYGCQGCAAARSKNKGKKSKNEGVQTETKDVQNEDVVSSTTFKLNFCEKQKTPIIIEDTNILKQENLKRRKGKHESCGEIFLPSNTSNTAKENSLLNAIYTNCVRQTKSKIKNGEKLVQEGEELKVKGKTLNEGELNDPQNFSHIAHMKTLHNCERMVANIRNLKEVFSEAFAKEFVDKIEPLKLYETDPTCRKEDVRVQPLDNAIRKVKIDSFLCELIRDAISAYVNNAEDIAYNILTNLDFNFDNAYKIFLDDQEDNILAKMRGLGFPNDMNLSQISEPFDNYEEFINRVTNDKTSHNYIVPNWYQRILFNDAQSKYSIRKVLMEYMVDSENVS